jgi:hypothetical protein
MLAIAPPQDPERAALIRVKCTAGHEERVCMGRASPSDFARRYLTVMSTQISCMKIFLLTISLQCLSRDQKCCVQHWLHDKHDDATRQNLLQKLEEFKGQRRQAKVGTSSGGHSGEFHF